MRVGDDRRLPLWRLAKSRPLHPKLGLRLLAVPYLVRGHGRRDGAIEVVRLEGVAKQLERMTRRPDVAKGFALAGQLSDGHRRRVWLGRVLATVALGPPRRELPLRGRRKGTARLILGDRPLPDHVGSQEYLLSGAFGRRHRYKVSDHRPRARPRWLPRRRTRRRCAWTEGGEAVARQDATKTAKSLVDLLVSRALN